MKEYSEAGITTSSVFDLKSRMDIVEEEEEHWLEKKVLVQFL